MVFKGLIVNLSKLDDNLRSLCVGGHVLIAVRWSRCLRGKTGNKRWDGGGR